MRVKSIDEQPLHWEPPRFDPAIDWWACSRPEAPYEPERTWLDVRCRACQIAAQTYIMVAGADEGLDESGQVRVSISGSLRAAQEE